MYMYMYIYIYIYKLANLMNQICTNQDIYLQPRPSNLFNYDCLEIKGGGELKSKGKFWKL